MENLRRFLMSGELHRTLFVEQLSWWIPVEALDLFWLLDLTFFLSLSKSPLPPPALTKSITLWRRGMGSLFQFELGLVFFLLPRLPGDLCSLQKHLLWAISKDLWMRSLYFKTIGTNWFFLQSKKSKLLTEIQSKWMCSHMMVCQSCLGGHFCIHKEICCKHVPLSLLLLGCLDGGRAALLGSGERLESWVTEKLPDIVEGIKGSRKHFDCARYLELWNLLTERRLRSLELCLFHLWQTL